MKVEVRKTITVPASQAWSKLKSFDGLDLWLPLVRTCSIETTPTGIKRFCGLANGASIVENLLALDEHSMTLRYNIEDGAMPFTGHTATISVEDLGGGRSEVAWSSIMEPAPGTAHSVREMLEGAYAEGIMGLQALCIAEARSQSVASAN